MDVKYPQVKVRLTGTDGNVFAIIGKVTKAMRNKNLRDEAAVFGNAAMACESYDAVLRLCMATVEVE